MTAELLPFLTGCAIRASIRPLSSQPSTATSNCGGDELRIIEP